MLIDALGKYKTRCGYVARIHEITTGNFTFPCKGVVEIPRKNSKGVIREYSIWKTNGSNLAIGTSPFDIIAKEF